MDHRRNPPARRLNRAATAAALLLAFGVHAATLGQQQFLPADEAFIPNAWVDEDTVTLAWQVAPGYYLYRHGFGASANGDELDATFPAGEEKVDDYFGKVEIYRDQVFATLPIAALGADDAVDITVRYQGCAEAGLCYPPTERTLNVQLAD